MKHFLFTIILISTVSSFAQSRLFNQSYNELEGFGFSSEEIAEYENEGELEVFNEAKHSTKLASILFDKKIGKKHKEKTRTGKKNYEVIAEREVMHYRINYIFLDGNKMSEKAIQRMRAKINEMLDKGIQFESLARQYSMDANAYNGGDSGWFKKERTVPIFFSKITDPKLLANEVYSIDLPEANWHYLVKKTFTPTTLREILVLIYE